MSVEKSRQKPFPVGRFARRNWCWRTPAGDPAVLHLDLEPGPGTGWEPLDLAVTSEDGRSIANLRVGYAAK